MFRYWVVEESHSYLSTFPKAEYDLSGVWFTDLWSLLINSQTFSQKKLVNSRLKCQKWFSRVEKVKHQDINSPFKEKSCILAQMLLGMSNSVQMTFGVCRSACFRVCQDSCTQCLPTSHCIIGESSFLSSLLCPQLSLPTVTLAWVYTLLPPYKTLNMCCAVAQLSFTLQGRSYFLSLCMKSLLVYLAEAEITSRMLNYAPTVWSFLMASYIFYELMIPKIHIPPMCLYSPAYSVKLLSLQYTLLTACA